MFTRLTALASWRSEYILRTRLLRSLARGKPAQSSHISTTSATSRGGSHHNALAAVTYNSQLSTTVNHLHATFGDGHSKKLPRFMHGADQIGSAGTSDPTTGKVDAWGFSDPQNFLQFAERFPGDAQWGLGVGDVVGVPNAMDVSQPFGAVYGEGSPGGLVYFRSVDELRGRFLCQSLSEPDREVGIPGIPGASESFCSVWIAKSPQVLSMTEGLIGILSGSSLGIVTAYSMGTDGLRDQRLGRGEVTARWVLSPGVPIIAISVDDGYSLQRRRRDRIWVVALNALGEVFYLTRLPKRQAVDRAVKLDERGLDRLAWKTGRSVEWTMVPPTRRRARVDPFDDSGVDGSHSPRSSWDGMSLRAEDLVRESRELEVFMSHRPKHYRQVCHDWEMRRRLEVDFAGDDGLGGGESIVVIGCGLEEGSTTSIKRFTKCQSDESRDLERVTDPAESDDSVKTSLFGEPVGRSGSRSTVTTSSSRSHSPASTTGSDASVKTTAEWQTTELSLGGYGSEQVTTSTIDNSRFALMTVFEDPLLSSTLSSSGSSPVSASPLAPTQPLLPYQVPGDRARLMAVGTKSGMVLVWNMRGPVSGTSELVNTLTPIRVIHTDSPQISSLALTALYLVHGGNDGLVQAWDPLASNVLPIRTLNSRFSSRARRRLVQAEASIQGVGINLFAAGAICLDPDPTVLRGMVSLGTQLRYWSYSASAADQYASRKRRLRRSERGSNSHGDRFSGTGRGALQEYIVNETVEHEEEKKSRREEMNYLAGRFGVGLLGRGESEEEILAYARMLSEETFAEDERRRSESDNSVSGCSSETVTPEGSVVVGGISSPLLAPRKEEDMDDDLARAIRLSLLEAGGDDRQLPHETDGRGLGDISVKYVKSKRSTSSSPPRVATSSKAMGASDTDLDFALQLSLAEQRSRSEIEREDEEAFPSLRKSSSTSPKGKGKGTRRAS